VKHGLSLLQDAALSPPKAEQRIMPSITTLITRIPSSSCGTKKKAKYRQKNGQKQTLRLRGEIFLP
jgi:hypothetical protein